ncbi:MAG: serine--tRNA ligase, partial [Methanobacteriota archaeon]
MLDIRLIREHPDVVRENLAKRGDPEKLLLLDKLIGLDKAWREKLQRVENLKHRRNVVSVEIAKKKRENKDFSDKLREMKELSREIQRLDEETKTLREEINKILLRLPNMLHESVPLGRDESENVEIRRWGTPPKFSFPPKNHLELMINLGLVDPERGSKVAGTGFLYFKNELVLLDIGIQRFAIDFLVKRGYTLVEPPFMMRRAPYEGVADLEDFEQVMYKIDGDDLYLIATSEHPLGAMYMNEVFNEDELPIKLVGVSPCFRREIGTHGKYTKGLFRMHQFNKVEQFIFSHPEESWKYHEELQKNSEEMYQALGLPYRVVNVCTGDIGSFAAKRYDT